MSIKCSHGFRIFLAPVCDLNLKFYEMGNSINEMGNSINICECDLNVLINTVYIYSFMIQDAAFEGTLEQDPRLNRNRQHVIQNKE